MRTTRESERRRDTGNAFFADPGSGRAWVRDDLAEELAEEFVSAVTGADDVATETRAAFYPEEEGGPFSYGRMEIISHERAVHTSRHLRKALRVG